MKRNIVCRFDPSDVDLVDLVEVSREYPGARFMNGTYLRVDLGVELEDTEPAPVTQEESDARQLVRIAGKFRLRDGLSPSILALAQSAERKYALNRAAQARNVDAEEEAQERLDHLIRAARAARETMAESPTVSDVDAVARKLEDGGVRDGDLDELVHDSQARDASAVNNGGLRSQVEYLLGCGYTEAEILAAVCGGEE